MTFVGREEYPSDRGNVENEEGVFVVEGRSESETLSAKDLSVAVATLCDEVLDAGGKVLQARGDEVLEVVRGHVVCLNEFTVPGKGTE